MKVLVILLIVLPFWLFMVRQKIKKGQNWLKFAPKHSFTECTELFSNSTEAADFKMSEEFRAGLKEFLEAVDNATKVGILICIVCTLCVTGYLNVTPFGTRTLPTRVRT